MPLTCLQSVRQCMQVVLDAGLEMPPWQELVDSLPPRKEEQEPTQLHVGWQQRPPGSWRRSSWGRNCGLASVTVPGHCCVPNTDL